MVSRSYWRPRLHIYLAPGEPDVDGIGDFEPVTNTKAPRKSAAHYRRVVSTIPGRPESPSYGRPPGQPSIEGPVNSHRPRGDTWSVVRLWCSSSGRCDVEASPRYDHSERESGHHSALDQPRGRTRICGAIRFLEMLLSHSIKVGRELISNEPVLAAPNALVPLPGQTPLRSTLVPLSSRGVILPGPPELRVEWVGRIECPES